MNIRYAEFPFLDAATDAVEEDETDLNELLTDPDNPVVKRGFERVRQTIEDGMVDTAIFTDTDYSPEEWHRIEVLSYPIARVLVSALNSQPVVDRYAYGEAVRAVTLLQDEDQIVESGIDLHELLDEFDFTYSIPDESAVEPTYDLDIGDFLAHLPDDAESDWLLQARAVDDGRVPVSKDDMYILLEEAIAARVGDDLPLDVPDPLLDGLDDELASLRRLIQDFSLPRDLDAVIPELFPPGIRELFKSVQDDNRLDSTERFVLFTFLARAGLSSEEILSLYGDDPPTPIADQAQRVAENGFPTPNYEALVAAGICDADTVDTGHHPLLVYRNRIEQAELDRYTDWRDTLYRSATPD